MKLSGKTLFVAGNDGYSEMNLSMLVTAVQGGMQLVDVAIFTHEEEASREVRRRQLVEKGISILQRLDLDDLEAMVPSLEKEALDRSVERTMDKVLG
jgi:hypothetical protein